MVWIFLFLVAACSTTSVELAEDCDVQLSELVPVSVEPGAEVSAAVHPVTTVWDTAVYMGSTRTRVLDVTREGCTECDDCRSRQGCSACEDCDRCDAVCDSECIETVTFEALEDVGVYAVSIYNGYGQSNFASIEVLDDIEDDSGVTDSGGTDVPDTGSSALGDTGVE